LISLSLSISANNLSHSGSIDPYCEITIGSLTLKTPYIKKSIKPKWNAPMQFLLYDFVEDVIHINLFDNEVFSPNGFYSFINVLFFFILKKISFIF